MEANPREMTDLPFNDPDWAEELPPGWRRMFNIEIANLVDIFNHYEISPNRLWFGQVKEKYGRATIFWDLKLNTDDEYYDELYAHTSAIMDNIEEASQKMCHDCGERAKYLSKGWICPYCKKCAEDWLKRFNDLRGVTAKFNEHFRRLKI